MRMEKEKIELYEGKALMCPHCGHDNLHQETIEVFSRSEDEEVALVTRAGGRASSAALETGQNNPPVRRQGMLISFECEHGCPSPVLAIYQHKGTTYVDWDK